MNKPICVKCQKEMKMLTAGVTVFEMASSVNGVYKIWQADLWHCTLCLFEIVHGYGMKPIAEHFHDNFDHIVKQYLKAHSEGTERVIYSHEYRNSVQLTK